jgi:hypothetical protein
VKAPDVGHPDRDPSLVALSRTAGLEPIADHLDAGGVPQVQLTEGLQRRLDSVGEADGVLGRAVDRLIGSPGAEVVDAGGHLVAASAGESWPGPASRPADARFLIDALGTAKGPYEPVRATSPGAGRSWQKSSFSKGVYCVEVAPIDMGIR